MNVLIIEDDARIADFLQRGLRAEGFRVQVARNGRDGLELAREAWKTHGDQGTTTVVILDLMLPDISGQDVCHTLRAAQVQLPVLMLTALSTVEDRVAGLRLGRTITFVNLSISKNCWRASRRSGVAAESCGALHQQF